MFAVLGYLKQIFFAETFSCRAEFTYQSQGFTKAAPLWIDALEKTTALLSRGSYTPVIRIICLLEKQLKMLRLDHFKQGVSSNSGCRQIGPSV